MLPIKVNTINQYKVIKYLEKEFVIEDVKLEIVDVNTIRLIDCNGKSAVFSYDGLNYFFNGLKIKKGV